MVGECGWVDYKAHRLFPQANELPSSASSGSATSTTFDGINQGYLLINPHSTDRTARQKQACQLDRFCTYAFLHTSPLISHLPDVEGIRFDGNPRLRKLRAVSAIRAPDFQRGKIDPASFLSGLLARRHQDKPSRAYPSIRRGRQVQGTTRSFCVGGNWPWGDAIQPWRCPVEPSLCLQDVAS